jgi:outer membrane receptor for Fe3+-dicitrate
LIEYQKQRDEVLNNEKLTSEQKIALQLELAQQEQQQLAALQQTIDEANTLKELEKLDAEMKKAENDFEMQRSLLDQKQALIDAQYKYDLDKQAEYNAATEANTNARIELDRKEKDAKLANASQIAGLLNTVSNIAGKNTAAGKATAIASTTIDTYVGAQKAYVSQMQLTPDSPIRAAIAAAVALATGIKNVREIAKVKVPGGSAASAPSVNAAAPGGVPQVPTIGNSPITALGQAMQPAQPLRAYVVESEVTGSQKRVADIERRAGF